MVKTRQLISVVLSVNACCVCSCFAGVIEAQTRLMFRCEGKNKRAREDVAREGGGELRCSSFFLLDFLTFVVELFYMGYHQYL